MLFTTEQYQADRRKMKSYIAVRIPEEGIEVVLAEGEGGDVCVQLDPVPDDDGQLDLHWETNCKEAVGLREIYDHFRRQEMTVADWRRELAVGCCKKVVLQETIATPPPDTQPPEGDSAQLAMLEAIAQGFSKLEKMLALSRVKETYTAEEVAAQVRKSGWVVRQWCNKGQVPGAYKIQTGRGKKGEWRIPHEAVNRLHNEGPLPLDE